MRTALVAFAGGCAAIQVQAALPPVPYVAMLAIVGLASGAFAMRVANGTPRLGLGIASGALLGLAWAASFAHYRLADALAPELEGRDVEIIGVVASLPQHFERGVRFEFTPDKVITAGAQVPSRIQLVWYGGFGPESDAPDPAVSAGERWQLNVRLRRPHGSANPHGFDYEAWLLEKGIGATGHVRPARSDSPHRLLSPFVWSPGTVVDRARERIRTRLENALDEASHGGVIVALAVGDQRAIDGEDWQLFTRTGVGHLMSISGLHVTMIASLAAFVTHFAWRRSRRLMLALATPRAAAAIGFVAAFGYCLMAGFAVPAQRTLFMLAVAAWSLWSGWFGSGLRVLAIALALVCLLDPWAALSPGFWLSFSAVAILIVTGANMAPRTNWLKAALMAQMAVSLGLVPLTLALFQQVSIAGPLANAIAIPVVSFVITPLALLASIVPIDALAQASHAVLAWLMEYLGLLAGQDWAVWQRAAPPPWTVVLALAGIVWFLIPWWPHWRVHGAIWTLPLIVHPAPAPAPGDLWLAFLDVGQGLAVVARTANHNLVFDAGPKYSPDSDGGNRVIVPYLRGEGIERIDGMVLSHDDIDHTGGALSTVKAMPTTWVATSLPSTNPLAAQGIPMRNCVAGQTWRWDDVNFTFLHPSAADLASRTQRKDNAQSCVLAISAHGKTILLTADIESDVETALVAASANLKSDLLQVPHHGSRTSSTSGFLDAVAPAAAVISVGYRNRFRHPATEVVNRYAERDIRVLRTDESGAVLVRVASDGIQIRAWRDMRARYWQLR